MSNPSEGRRRKISLALLIISAVMLIAGQTVLKPHLRQQAFVYYWSVCFLFNGLTLLAALLDFRAIRHRARAEQKELIKKTLLTPDIEAEIDAPSKPDGKSE
jgi:hypothetical protein